MTNTSPPWERVDIALRRDLRAQGYDDRAIARRVRSGELIRIRHGAYVPATGWNGLSRQEQHQLLARALLRVAHPSTVLSHFSAAIEWGAPTWGVDLSAVHVTRLDGKSGRREAGTVRHRGLISPEDVAEVNGVRVTNGTRAAIEVTTIAPVEAALVTVNGLVAVGATTVADLHGAEHDHRHWPWSLRTRVVVGLANGLAASAGESRTLYLCFSQHLPRPECQVPIHDESGYVIAYVDFAWPGIGVFLEFDGRAKYRRFRRKGETLEQYLMREKHREEQICQLTGWICIRITWEDLAHPVRTAARIRRILESRVGSGAVPRLESWSGVSLP